MQKTLKKVIAIVIISFVIVFIYTFFHEAGHALAAILSGGRITSFDVNFLTGNPHIRYSGVTRIGAQAFIAIAGPLFPFVLWLVSLGWMRRVRHNITTRMVFLMVSIQALATLLANAVLPLLHMQGVALGGEDVVKFLTLAGIHPLIVSVLFFTLLLSSGWLVFSLLRPIDLLEYLKQMRGAHTTPRERVVLIAAGLLMVIGAVSVVARVTSGNGNSFKAPKDYDTRLQVSFTGLSSEWNTLQEFSVSNTKEYDFVYALRVNAHTTLRLVTDNPEGILYTDKEQVVLCESAISLTQAQFTGYALLPGNYRLEVKTEDKSGHIDMYISSRELDAEHASFLTLLQELKAGLFVAEDYRDDGFELVYQGSLEDVSDKTIYSLGDLKGSIAFTVLVSGAFDNVTVQYTDSQLVQPILTNTRATVGFGVTPRVSQGQLVLTSSRAEGQVYVFIKR